MLITTMVYNYRSVILESRIGEIIEQALSSLVNLSQQKFMLILFFIALTVFVLSVFANRQKELNSVKASAKNQNTENVMLTLLWLMKTLSIIIFILKH